MAYAILRTTKIKSHAEVAGSISHAERTRETKNADPEKLQDNVTYVKFDEDRFYNDVEANRTVKPPVDPKNLTVEELRNSNVIAIEILLTASPEYFENKTREDVLKWADDNIKFAGQKFGEDNIRNAILHLDEKTPHVTLMVIPLKEHGLSCKSWLGKKSDMRRMQTEYAKAMEPYGLKRGEKGSIAEHQTIQEYYTELEKIKAEALALNPAVKVEVTPDQLREPGLKDKMNTTAYKAEVIKDTVGLMQDKIDDLTDKNKTLTAKLITAENTIKKQTKELTSHRERATKGREDLQAYSQVKEAIKAPHIAQAIHFENNPHIAYAVTERSKGMNETNIAYNLIKNRHEPLEKVKEAMEYGRTNENSLIPINSALDRIRKEMDIADKAKQQAKAQADKAKEDARQAKKVADEKAKEKAQDMKERQPPHIYVYRKLQAQLEREGVAAELIDRKIALNMSTNFSKKNIEKAIAHYSKLADDDSVKANTYAKTVTEGISCSFDKMKGKKITTGGGLDRSGVRTKTIERDIVTDRVTDGLLQDFMNPRGGVSCRAKLFREDENEEFMELLKSGVDPEFN